MKHVLILFSVVFMSANVFAQDIHLSQYNASPLNLNPSLTGLFDGDFRFVGNQKTQWTSVSVPLNVPSHPVFMSLEENTLSPQRSKTEISKSLIPLA